MDVNFAKKDPTLSKPLIIAVWIRSDLQEMASRGLFNAPQLASLGNRIDDLTRAYLTMNRIDTLVLPLPYSQLLKIFTMFFVYTVPFVLAPRVGLFTPFVSLFLAAGYFGLDQVGAELECPFGTDDNDLPLLEMGLDLMSDVDTMLRNAARGIKRANEHKRAAAANEHSRHAAKRSPGGTAPSCGAHAGGGDDDAQGDVDDDSATSGHLKA